LDIGGTKIAVGLARPEGEVLLLRRFPTPLSSGPRRILDAAMDELDRMLAETGARLRSIGVGCGGPLDRERGLILSPPNLPGWDEVPVVRLLEERLGVPALLDNDANAAALGEHEYGAARGLRNFVYVTISTGIGAGVIIDGRVLHGVGDGAGEVGHILVAPDGPPCGCGSRGCLEAVCSGTSIARRAAERLNVDARPSLLREAFTAKNLTARAVAEAAERGDAVAREVWDETCFYLARGISNFITVLAPEAVILGGGVATAGEQLLAPVQRQVRETVKILPIERVQIVQAALAGDSGIYGTLLLGRHALARETPNS
jgi:glucokinase